MSQQPARIRAEGVSLPKEGEKSAQQEPLHPIMGAQGEVGSMQRHLAERLSGQIPEGKKKKAENWLEALITSSSRMSGYTLMGLALFGIATLIL